MATAPTTCPSCRTALPPEAYFCPNCGRKLRERPPLTSLSRQVIVYLVSFFLPPFGLWYVWKYLRWPDRKLRAIGVAALILTTISIVVTIWTAAAIINTVNQYIYNAAGL